MMFANRVDAGRQLAEALVAHAPERPVVFALPRGGVPVAAEVARRLHAPLDVLIVRKLGVPWHPEYAFGALGEGGVSVIDDRVVASAGMTRSDIERVVESEQAEIRRRASLYRGDRSPQSVQGRTVVVVDDGLATGSTMTAAVRVLNQLNAARVVVAVPVGSRDAARHIGSIVDGLVCLMTPSDFRAVGQYYADFGQLEDEDVIRMLAEYGPERSAAQRTGKDPGATSDMAGTRTASLDPADLGDFDSEVVIEADGVRLYGHLTVPRSASGIVVFAHGSGSSRRSPRNQYVARVLNEAGLGTLLFDLLTDEEAADRHNVFDIDLLARRLAATTRWLGDQAVARGKSVGFFGASTGAAAALVAAAGLPAAVSSVVSRGGRPDLAGRMLGLVVAPTLLIVGDRDYHVIELNRDAQRRLRCPSRLVLVPGATHLFEEPGTLEKAADLARRHFLATLESSR